MRAWGIRSHKEVSTVTIGPIWPGSPTRRIWGTLAAAAATEAKVAWYASSTTITSKSSGADISQLRRVRI